MRILLFDIDGTLLLTNSGGKGALQLAIAEEFGVESVCTEVSFAGRTDRSLLAELLERNGLPSDSHHLSRLCDRYVDRLPGVLQRRGGKTLPGVTELMPRLAQTTGVHCYAMTGNLEQAASKKLAHFDLLEHVRGIFGGDFDAHRDDLARRSAAALRERYHPDDLDEMVVIGDTPADIRCGHAIGAKVVAVCTGFFDRAELEAEGPMCVEDDLSDVDRLIDVLANGSEPVE